MIKRGMLILGVFFCVFSLWAQKSKAVVNEITSIVNDSDHLFESKPSLGVNQLHYALALAKKNHLVDCERDVLDKLATVMITRMNDFERAMYYMSQLKRLADSSRNVELKLFYEDKLGELYYYDATNHEKAYKQFERALSLSEQSNTNYRRDNILCNYGIALIAKGQFKKALRIYREGLTVSRTNNNQVLESAILNNMGVAFIYLNLADSAHYYLESSLKIALLTPEKTDDVQRYIYMGLFSLDQGEPTLALSYFDQAKKRLNDLPTNNEKAQLFRGISKAYAAQNNFQLAYENRLTELVYIDSSRQSDLSNQSFAYDYKLRINRLKTTSRLNQLRLRSENERANLWLIISILVALTAIGVIYILVKRQKSRRILNAIQSENQRLEKERMQLELDATEREVAAKALYLLEKDNLVNGLSDKLRDTLPKGSKEQQEVIQDLIRELKGNLNNKRWEEFELRFEKVNPQFFSALENDFPGLTPNERKLCAFLSLNMSSKEISAITGQTVHSITIARSRLRKKLNLTHTEVDLISFLSKYTYHTD